MSGEETEDELNRIAIWDAVYKEGAMEPGEISKLLGLSVQAVSRLTKHEWFMKMHGLIYIATVDGVRRRGLMVAKG